MKQIWLRPKAVDWLRCQGAVAAGQRAEGSARARGPPGNGQRRHM